MCSIARELAEFVVAADFGYFPREVKHQAKRCMMDIVGVIFAGSHYADSGQFVCKYAERLRENETSTIIGTGMKRSVYTASLANGVMAHALELDDGSKHATYHPGSSILPAVFALAEREKINGEKMIEAIILGYEISLRIG